MDQRLQVFDTFCRLVPSHEPMNAANSAPDDREWNFLMLDWTTCLAVEHDPEKLSGAWVFRGSRVPVSALFENLESGATLDQFLAWFPGVTRAQAESVLEHAARSLQAV